MTTRDGYSRYLIVVLIAAAFIALAAVTFPLLLRWVVTDFLETRLNLNEIQIQELNLHPAGNTVLTATGITANHELARLSVQKLTLSIDTSSLIFPRPPEIHQLIISNWQADLEDSPDSIADLDSEPQKDIDAKQLLNQILVEFSHPVNQIENFILEAGVARVAHEDQPITLEISQARLANLSSISSVLDLDAKLNGSPLNLDAELERSDANTVFSALGKWQSYALELNGNLSSITPLENLNATLVIKSPHSKPVLSLLGAPEVRDGEFSIETNLQDNNGLLKADGSAMFGSITVSGELDYDLSSANFELDFDLSGPSLKEAGALLDFTDYHNQPFTLTGLVLKNENELSLSGGRIQLGNGYFSAEGTLPSYPSLKDWQLKLDAKQFDLSFLQPLVDCPLPQLALDWRGEFFTDKDGMEHATLTIHDSNRQSVDLNGHFNNDPDVNGAEVRVTLTNVDTSLANNCLNLSDRSGVVVSGEISFARLNDVWQLSNVDLNTEAATLTGDISPTGEMKVTLATQNIKSLASLTDRIPFVFKKQPASLSAMVKTDRNKIAFNQGTISLGASTGRFSAESTFEGNGHFAMTIEGLDIKEISDDLPISNKEQLPFELTASLTLEEASELDGELSLKLANNSLIATGRTDIRNPLYQTDLAINGAGPHLEILLGAFVPYPLPPEPYNFAAEIKSEQGSLSINNLALSVGEQSLKGALLLDHWPNVEQTRGQLVFNSNSSHAFQRLLNTESNIQDVPVEISIDVTSSRDEIAVDILNAQFGSTDLDGAVTYSPGPEPRLNAKLTSKSVHLPTFVPVLETSTDATKDPIDRSQPIIPDFQIPWQALDDHTVEFEWSGDAITLKQDQLATAKIKLAIADKQLTSEEFSWRSELNEGTINLVATAQDANTGSVEFEMLSRRIPALWLFTGTPKLDPDAKLRFHTKLTGTGSTTRELAGDLSGAILFQGGGGRLSSARLDSLFGDFLHQLTTTVFKTGDQQTRVQCSAGALQVTNGKIKFEPGIAVRTSRFDVLTTGDITLPDEKLKLTLTSRSRKGIGVSAATTLVPRVGVRGTIVKPQIQLNARDTALTGGAAIASSGLSLLATGLWDRLRSSVENPCNAVYSRAVKQGKDIYRDLAG